MILSMTIIYQFAQKESKYISELNFEYRQHNRYDVGEKDFYANHE